MVDYAVGTGSGGTLIIRDNGSLVQAIIKNTNGSTFVNGATWRVDLGGGAATGTFNINGSQEVVVWQSTVSSTVGMTLTMGATGTSGLGGPASVSATIQRATVPVAPTMLGIDQVTHQAFRVRFSGNGNGGSAITQYQIGYGLNPSTPTNFVASGGTTTINITAPPGSTVYAWARAANAVGWSGWSGKATAVLLPGAKVRVSSVVKDAVPYVKVGGVYRPAIPYIKKNGVWTPTSY